MATTDRGTRRAYWVSGALADPDLPASDPRGGLAPDEEDEDDGDMTKGATRTQGARTMNASFAKCKPM